MSTPHKHAATIKAWADGAEVEVRHIAGEWVLTHPPLWAEFREYRVKRAPIEVTETRCYSEAPCGGQLNPYVGFPPADGVPTGLVRYTFDPYTKEMLSVELVKEPT